MKSLIFCIIVIALSHARCLGDERDARDAKLRSLVKLATVDSIADELGILKPQRDSLRILALKIEIPSQGDLIKEFYRKNGRFPIAGEKISNPVPIDESELSSLLSESQIKQLNQIYYQNQIVKFGLRNTILRILDEQGQNLDPNKKQVLNERLLQIELQMQESVAKIVQEMQLQAIDELPPESQPSVTEAIGKPFFFEKFLGLDLNSSFRRPGVGGSLIE